MDVILLDDIKGLGKRGEIKKTKDGYARNYLIPKGLVAQANESNIANFENLRRNLIKKADKELAKAMEDKRAIESKNPFTITVKAGKEGKLYGSVTNGDISNLILQNCDGLEVDKRKVDRDAQIREIGEYTIPIRLFQDTVAQMTLRVADEEGNIKPQVQVESETNNQEMA